VAVRARGVYAGPGTPYHLRPVVGGTGSLRGFRDASLSGPLGARALWQVTGEIRMPLVGRESLRPRVLGLLFADLGDHWNDTGERFGFSAGVGYGLRVHVPWIQIFGVDAGIPLTDESTNDPFWVHGTLGFTF
ncbi:MAG: BamA/TamA family outer membrane protein, partial [Candidatus Krumholzibacteriia bacterium]